MSQPATKVGGGKPLPGSWLAKITLHLIEPMDLLVSGCPKFNLANLRSPQSRHDLTPKPNPDGGFTKPATVDLEVYQKSVTCDTPEAVKS